MSKLTPEERKARAKQRRAELEESWERLPDGRIDNIGDKYGVILDLEAGTEPWLRIRTRGIEIKGDQEWRLVGHVILRDNLREQAEFITALVCRYNEQVRRLNAESARVPAMERIEEISSRNAWPTSPVKSEIQS